jgi:hypothetical protein
VKILLIVRKKNQFELDTGLREKECITKSLELFEEWEEELKKPGSFADFWNYNQSLKPVGIP